MTLPVGQRVRYWRELRGLSQSDLADKAKIDNTKLCRIESGKIRARVVDIETIAKALDLSMAEFYGDNGEARAS